MTKLSTGTDTSFHSVTFMSGADTPVYMNSFHNFTLNYCEVPVLPPLVCKDLQVLLRTRASRPFTAFIPTIADIADIGRPILKRAQLDHDLFDQLTTKSSRDIYVASLPSEESASTCSVGMGGYCKCFLCVLDEPERQWGQHGLRFLRDFQAYSRFDTSPFEAFLVSSPEEIEVT